ncbi:MAG: hypothetical protein PHY08_10090 [Candidatus Cloacimonetes bacterium]|nr:hypothetical protein [Candidatus Cloacimonadota bacterium]
MKYKITCDINTDIEANDEQEACVLFYEELAEMNDCIDNYIVIEEIDELSECEKQILDKEGEEALARYQGRI